MDLPLISARQIASLVELLKNDTGSRRLPLKACCARLLQTIEHRAWNNCYPRSLMAAKNSFKPKYLDLGCNAREARRRK